MSFYFIYKINQVPGSMVKNLQKVERFDNYKEAKKLVKDIRNNKTDDDLALYRIVFAESELDAEEILYEKREEQIVREWEK